MKGELFIRADASVQIGTGHIMRCIALAQAWQDKGGKVTFISHCESEKLRDRIITEGFDLITIDYPHPHPSDIEKTISTIKHLSSFAFDIAPTWLVLDGYHFTPDYQKAIREAGIRLLVIDDMNHLPHYHADILLNQNIYAPELRYNCDAHTKLLLGTKYVLLRREFLKYKDLKREMHRRARKILVFMGGADPTNETGKVLKALKLLNRDDVAVDVVIGASNPFKDEIITMAKQIPHVTCHFDVNNMAELMSSADMGIGAGGTSTWERCCIGLPSIIMVLADNQKKIAEELEKEGVVVNLGWHEEVTEMDIRDAAQSLLADADKRRDMGLKGKGMVDGNGARRTAQEMLSIFKQVSKEIIA